MPDGELNDEANPPGGVLSVKHQSHLCSLALFANQLGNLLQVERRMPVIPGGLRASHQTHAHTAKPLTEFKVLPAIELEGGVEQS